MCLGLLCLETIQQVEQGARNRFIDEIAIGGPQLVSEKCMHFRGQFLARTQSLTVTLVLAVARRTLRTYSPVRVLRSTLRAKLRNVPARIPLRWTFVVFAVHELFDTFELKSGTLPVFGIFTRTRPIAEGSPLLRDTAAGAQRTLNRYSRMRMGIGIPRIHRRTGRMPLLRISSGGVAGTTHPRATSSMAKEARRSCRAQ